MPAAAIATGAVDHVVALDEIGPMLVDLVRQPEARGRVA
jgi:chemotaxis response regulator CheB